MSFILRHARRTSPALAVLAAAAAFAFVAADAAHAETPVVGGLVPSVLSLSLSQPSSLSFAIQPHARSRARRGERLYTATIGLTVTATETPTRLSISDGEASAGKSRGHLVRGRAVLSPALQAAAGRGAYRSLDRRVDTQLAQWSQPLANETATIRLRQAYRGGAGQLRRYHKLLLVTVTAGGP